MTEEWRTIPEFPDYEVSDLGRIRNWKGKVLNPGRSGWKKKYRYATLRKFENGRRISHSRSVARLVITTFRGPPPDGHECCHDNGIHDDDRLDNLVWGTHAKNMRDTRRHGTWWRTGRQTLRPEDIGTVFELHAKGWTQVRIAEHMGVRQPQISRILNRKTWDHDLGEAEFRCSAELAAQEKKPRKAPRPEPVVRQIPAGRPVAEKDIPQVMHLARAGSTRFEIAEQLDLCPVAITRVLLDQHVERPQ